MYITKINDDYNDTLSINNICKNNDNNFEIILPLNTIIPCGMSLICLISLMVYSLIKPNHPTRCIITGPIECGKSVFLTNLVLNIFNEYNKIYIYSPSLHQNLYRKLNKCFSNYIPLQIIPNILNEEYIDRVIKEIVSNKDFENSNIY